MPLIVPTHTAKWLLTLKAITVDKPITGEVFELSYNDQIYLENGYLIGKVLRAVIKASGETV